MRQIIYFSTAAGRQDATITTGILAVSRVCNFRDQISGLLVAGGHRYLQVIEGPSDAIGSLIERLQADERHVSMTVLVDRRVRKRAFDGWSMAFADEPRLGEFATLRDLSSIMWTMLSDSGLRDQIDCFVDTFATGGPAIVWPSSAFDRGHQRGVAAGRGGVDAGHPLGREARDIMRAAGLGPGAGQSLAAERLAFDHRADLVAVDVEIADPGMSPRQSRAPISIRLCRPKVRPKPVALIASTTLARSLALQTGRRAGSVRNSR